MCVQAVRDLKIYVFFSRIWSLWNMWRIFFHGVRSLNHWGGARGGDVGSVPRYDVSELFFFFFFFFCGVWIIASLGVFLVAQMVKICQQYRFDPWVKKITWRRKWPPTPVFLPGEPTWTEEPGWWQSMRSQRVRHDWVTKTFTFTLGVFHSVMSWRWFYICATTLEVSEFLWDVWYWYKDYELFFSQGPRNEFF